MNINLDYFKTFYYVAKSGSITKASHILLNNQPNVTRTIQILEKELGCLLFERSKKGVTLTTEGKVLYNRMLVVMKELELAIQDIENRKVLNKGSVSIAATEIALYGILLESLRKYKREYPQIQLSVSNQTTKEALESVQNGEADFALVTGDVLTNSAFEIVPLKQFKEIPICSDYYKELYTSKISLSKLSQYPLISLHKQSMYYEFYKKILKENGNEMNAIIEAASITQILPMVANDLGIGFIPEMYFDQVSNYKNVKKILLDIEIPMRTIFMAKRKNVVSSIASHELETLIIRTSKNTKN